MKSQIIALVFTLATLPHFASAFTFVNNRYPGPGDFKELLMEKFPSVQTDAKKRQTKSGIYSSEGVCLLTNQNAYGYANSGDQEKLWGINDPSTGEPYSKAPSPAFVQWYAKCAGSIVNADFTISENDTALLDRYLNKAGLEILVSEWQKINPGWSWSRFDLLHQVAWSQVSKSHRDSLLRHLVESFVGPGVLTAAQESALLARMRSGTSRARFVEEAIRQGTFVIVMSDEFLLAP